MIQILPNELQIEILTYVVAETNDSYDDLSKILSDHNISFTASVERNDIPSPIKFGVELGDLTWLEFLNDDICKYEFDHRSNICFKREIKVNEDRSISYVKPYSFTIEAWKLYYILDCLKFDT
ncbi:13870_t:CDS:2 [Racocetra fulgida]|uniref:13870_t:CDS:1 n=1 Tax=Racocetra fulgida TaxID=60492 RepID=A0A9N9FK87_9GLOM|nr:13870_t:CDS:2 [Racocetra fulgida]